MELGKTWIAIKDDGNDYLIKCRNPDRNQVIITATDFIQLWQLKLDSETLCRILQGQNPLIESDFEDLLKVGLSLFSPERNDVQRSVLKQDAGSLNLVLRTDIAGIAFELQLNLLLLSAEDFHKVITLPLFATMKELLTRQNIMSKLLRDKDLEIQQHRLEGSVLTRKHLETSPFEEKLFEISRECKLSTYTETPTLLFDERFVHLFGIISENINKIENLKRKNVVNEVEEEISKEQKDVPCNKLVVHNVDISMNIKNINHNDVEETKSSGIRKLAPKRKKYVTKLMNL